MKHHSIPYLLTAILMATSAGAAEDRRAAPEISRYCFADLGVDSTLNYLFVVDMNQHGQMLGYGNIGDISKDFLWDRRGGFQIIEDPTQEQEFPGYMIALNDRRQIAGTRNTGPDGTILRAFFWDLRKDMRLLEPLPGHDRSTAVEINNRGQVVGTSGIALGFGTEDSRSVIWDHRSRIQVLPNLPGGFGSYPTDINEAGQVVGLSTTPEGTLGYIWDPNRGIRMIEGLPGDVSSSPDAINDHGEVVGSGAFADGLGGSHAIFWSEESGVVDLGDLPGLFENSGAFDINNHRQIVGHATDQDGGQAVIWDSQGRMHMLDELVIRDKPGDEFQNLLYGWKINDAGWITVVGYDTREGDLEYPFHIFLLTPAQKSADGSYQCACKK